MKKLTKILITSGIAILSAVSSCAYAQNKSSKDTPALEFHQRLVGMNDTKQEATIRGKSSGLSLQHISYSEESLANLKLDEAKLAFDFNQIIKSLSPYFKERPSFKGNLFLAFTLYTGHLGPYQFTPEMAKELKIEDIVDEVNKNLRESSVCNDKLYCSFLSLHNVMYFDDDGKDTLDVAELEKSFQSIYDNKMSHFPTSNKNIRPVFFSLILGTNGKLVPQKEADIIFETN